MKVQTGVSIIVPCYNEEIYLENFLESLLKQTYPHQLMEVIIADGLSTDRTPEILREYSKKYPFIQVIPNEKKTVPYGLNKAIQNAIHDIIIRMDVHTLYDQNYVAYCVETLQKTNCANVGGAWRAVGNTFLQKAIAFVFLSPLVIGGASSRKLDYEGYVDTVYLGCWSKNILKQIGGFDPFFTRNQDDELNYRLIKSGFKIWQSPQILSWYYPRSSLRSLFKQYFQYGYWKPAITKKHSLPAKLRHFIPGIFVLVFILFLTLAVFFPKFSDLFWSLTSLYFFLVMGATLQLCLKQKTWKYFFIFPVIVFTLHFSYGLGFLLGLKILFKKLA